MNYLANPPLPPHPNLGPFIWEYYSFCQTTVLGLLRRHLHMATFVLVAVFQKIFGPKIILTQNSFKLKINIDMAERSMESFLLFLDIRF